MTFEGPIFLLGLQRGGTNLLLNILRSHPDVTWPEGEFHEVLRSRGSREKSIVVVLSKLRWYLPILFTRGHLLRLDRFPPRGSLRGLSGACVKRALHHSALRNSPTVARAHAELNRRGQPAGTPQRLVCKVVNGNVVLARDLRDLYQDAIFLAMVRHPYAVCEGQSWRGASLERTLEIYNRFLGALDALAEENAQAIVVRYEDLLDDPVGTALRVYEHCRLDRDKVRWVRLEEKLRTRYGTSNKNNQYYLLDDIGRHIVNDRNAEQAGRLSEAQRTTIASACQPVFDRFEYQA